MNGADIMRYFKFADLFASLVTILIPIVCLACLYSGYDGKNNILITVIGTALTMAIFLIGYQTYKINLINYNLTLVSKKSEIYKVLIETLTTVSKEGYLPKDLYLNFSKARLEAKIIFEDDNILQYLEEIHNQLNDYLKYQEGSEDISGDKRTTIRENFSNELLECHTTFDRYISFRKI